MVQKLESLCIFQYNISEVLETDVDDENDNGKNEMVAVPDIVTMGGMMGNGSVDDDDDDNGCVVVNTGVSSEVLIFISTLWRLWSCFKVYGGGGGCFLWSDRCKADDTVCSIRSVHCCVVSI